MYNVISLLNEMKGHVIIHQDSGMLGEVFSVDRSIISDNIEIVCRALYQKDMYWIQRYSEIMFIQKKPKEIFDFIFADTWKLLDSKLYKLAHL